MTERIDAHQHFWQVSRRDYPWLTADAFPALYRDFEPADLAPLIGHCGIGRTILVQGAQTEDETNFLLHIARSTDFVAGVVGWTDLLAADAPAGVAAMAAKPKLVALRPMLEVIEDDDWILDSRLSPGIRAMVDCGLRFDALIRPRHLPRLSRLLDTHGDLRVVVDHAAKPDIAGREIASWSRDIRDLARNTEASVKLSGLATESERGWDAESLRPYVEVLIDAFTPERIMWGSDWPVLNVAGDYVGWYEIAQSLTADLSADDRAWIFGKTAETFYGIGGQPE
jgi:L-fuconolactonase